MDSAGSHRQRSISSSCGIAVTQRGRSNGEQKPQKRGVIGRNPLIYLQQRLGQGANTRFFPQFTLRRLNKGFVRLEMAGRLVPARLAVNRFLDH